MTEETKRCPFCGGEILATAKKCKHCKQYIPDQEENVSNSDTKICPFCSEEILVTAKKCKHCGEWLNTNNTQIKTSMTNCPFCGKVVSTDAEKCPNCGEWLKEENIELSCGYWLDNRATKFILNFSIVIAVITFIALLIATLSSDNFEQVVNGLSIAIVTPLIVFILCFISTYIYLLPTVFAVSRNHPQILPICLVNVFFGETVIGWISCMVWATTHRQGRHTHW